MATLLRRRDERDQGNDVTDDVEAKRDTTDGPSPAAKSFEERGSKIWLPYLELAEKYDKDLVHNWRDDMDSLLIFAALFSASVTAFVIESYNSLVQDPGEVTISVLLQISQQIANGTLATAAVRPSFQPATIDVSINILWFLSLAFSLTCALAAVLVRQWARQYLRYPRSFSSTSERARARQFVFENMEWWQMDLIVEMIPALLHISLILFTTVRSHCQLLAGHIPFMFLRNWWSGILNSDDNTAYILGIPIQDSIHRFLPFVHGRCDPACSSDTEMHRRTLGDIGIFSLSDSLSGSPSLVTVIFDSEAKDGSGTVRACPVSD
ncbi:hypothetical protein BD410DRAFT_835110 [Rickenella mellea]|uniref:DUF6535 domain-containing protein n=1 Tax=Rickenella mellea TaxID=50990 RepID=A0A4Y7QJH3_9AGAM|nr:hypothetical protein BD410DRAFT_835110 [Rickenella mellea]